MPQASGAEAAVCFAGVAQLVEHLFCKQVVRGSSPRASSAVGPRVGLTGSHARGFRVLASFAPRSDAHALKCVPLRSSRKPRQNAELRARVGLQRPLGAAAFVASAATRETSESCPSGQREQAVNLPDLSYAGSNPALSTSARRGRASVSISCLGELSSPSAEVNSAEPPPQVSGSLPRNSANETSGTKPSGFGFTGLGHAAFAGVAQLVERQPSKLNVEGSSPFSRSILSAQARIVCHLSFGGSAPAPAEVNSAGPLPRFWGPSPKTVVFGSVSHHESKPAQTFGQTRVASSVAGEVEARTGAERTPVREHRTAAETQPPAEIATRPHCRVVASGTHAHLAQMVEHVLGKDEVTSSILVVGSKQK